MAYFRCTTGGSGKGNTLVVTCADDLAGATITCTNGTKTYRKTCPSTAPYEVTFYGLEAGTWTLSATVSGNTYTATVVITDCAALLGGFNWRTWVDTAQFLDSSDYNSLDEVLADELAVRELCLEHACVDYLADIATTSADVETIIENDLFAKWVNNSDYALDFLGANTVIKALMDDADKYGYGEWVITDDTTTPPTWGAKGNVPVMTANNAPYGTAIANGAYTNYEAFRAFARRLNDVVDSATDSNHAAWAVNGSTGYIGYEFANPVEVTQIAYVPRYFNTECSKQSPATWQLEYSDDNSQWSIAQSYTEEITTQKEIRYRKLDTSFGYHRYWRMNITANLGSANFAGICALQFYGRELKVSIPKMDSATPPFGSLIYSIDPQNDNRPWYAFDNNSATAAMTASANQVPFKIGYDFEKLVHVAYLAYIPLKSGESSSLTSHTDTFYYSVDGTTWNVLATNEVTNANAKQINLVSFDPVLCKAVKYETDTPTMSNGFCSMSELLIFGKDYSEKEFEEGTTKKWLYDHGVELDTLNAFQQGTGGTTEKRVDELYFAGGSDNTGFRVASAIDLTPFALVRWRVGDEHIPNSNGYDSVNVRTSPTSSVSAYALIGMDLPNNGGIDISNVNSAMYIQANTTGNGKDTIKEWWLE